MAGRVKVIISLYNNVINIKYVPSLMIVLMDDTCGYRPYLVPNYSADVDECSEITHMCSQNCHNSVGSYVCTCDEGFIISISGTTCTGEFV